MQQINTECLTEAGPYTEVEK